MEYCIPVASTQSRENKQVVLLRFHVEVFIRIYKFQSRLWHFCKNTNRWGWVEHLIPKDHISYCSTSARQDSSLQGELTQFFSFITQSSNFIITMSLYLYRTSQASAYPKRVSFTPYVEINEFPPIDSRLKSTLYYSQDEINVIQHRLRQAIALRRKRLLMKQMEQELRENLCFQECSGTRKRTSSIDDLLNKKSRHIWCTPIC